MYYVIYTIYYIVYTMYYVLCTIYYILYIIYLVAQRSSSCRLLRCGILGVCHNCWSLSLSYKVAQDREPGCAQVVVAIWRSFLYLSFQVFGAMDATKPYIIHRV